MAIAANKKAYHDYTILEKLEVGIELKGTEVKSVKAGKTSIKESYVKILKDEVFILNMYIGSYEFGNIHNVDERRTRKLFLHKKEISKLAGKVSAKGFTLVPLKVYQKKRLIKLEIGLAQGKKLHDKREVLAKRDQLRDINRELKNYR
ncbi:SsrA-binding protein SmpB [Haliovirga abyssi]|uniref:SsrA-binding protein n=1 Tax=Haliovirga abyssi TaxID=2996794 RepID=A0AAU9DA59_9FUSO|nr:SsrA-binding protein SmpB [Haliovirga abyssi]BDU50215.1 SsrA-binding protein [Haliovirga abyssi]